MKSMRSSSTGVIPVTLVVVCILIALLPNLASSRRINRTHSRKQHNSIHFSLPTQLASLLNFILVNYIWRAGGGHNKATEQVMVKQIESYKRERVRMKSKPDTLQVAGSSLPDCSHACGSCFPCRLVMVSFVCSTLQEAETCPMAYKCMCRNKSFPVP